VTALRGWLVSYFWRGIVVVYIMEGVVCVTAPLYCRYISKLIFKFLFHLIISGYSFTRIFRKEGLLINSLRILGSY
jgi:hypothetical protein